MHPKDSSPFQILSICGEAEKCRDPIEEKIKSFLSLPEGWNFGEGSPPTLDTTERALKLYYTGKALGFGCEVFPVADGQIEISFYWRDHFIDILVDPIQDFDLTYEVGFGLNYREIEHIPNLTCEDVVTQLKEIRKVCNALESSETTIIRSRKGLPLGVLRIVGEEFQLSARSALSLFIVPPSAFTSSDFISLKLAGTQ